MKQFNREIRVMRDVFLEELHERMSTDKEIFFLSADFGSPKLDAIRNEYPDRFLNVGIAEQNLINVATGLALEGFKVYAYAIAPFLTMRAFEQIRNISLQAQLRDFNVNLVGVGAGTSYDVSGPTHHCIEDLIILRALPNITIISPSDGTLAKKLVDYTLSRNEPKYLRLDGKGLSSIYDGTKSLNINDGFAAILKGEGVCIVSTGYMTHKALKVAHALGEEGISVGVVDIFIIKPLDKERLFAEIKDYPAVLTLEEGFIGKGGLDSIVSSILYEKAPETQFKCMGFPDEYKFDIGSREYLHSLNKVGVESIMTTVKSLLNFQ